MQEKEMRKLLLQVLAQEDLSLSAVNRLIKKYLVFLNQHRSSSFSLSPLTETKKELIEIYNNSLAGALKSFNAKLAKERYVARK